VGLLLVVGDVDVVADTALDILAAVVARHVVEVEVANSVDRENHVVGHVGLDLVPNPVLNRKMQ
jgi:hypothetical protein